MFYKRCADVFLSFFKRFSCHIQTLCPHIQTLIKRLSNAFQTLVIIRFMVRLQIPSHFPQNHHSTHKECGGFANDYEKQGECLNELVLLNSRSCSASIVCITQTNPTFIIIPTFINYSYFHKSGEKQMFNNHWLILFIDSESDVLQVLEVVMDA